MMCLLIDSYFNVGNFSRALQNNRYQYKSYQLRGISFILDTFCQAIIDTKSSYDVSTPLLRFLAERTRPNVSGKHLSSFLIVPRLCPRAKFSLALRLTLQSLCCSSTLARFISSVITLLFLSVSISAYFISSRIFNSYFSNRVVLVSCLMMGEKRRLAGGGSGCMVFFISILFLKQVSLGHYILSIYLNCYRMQVYWRGGRSSRRYSGIFLLVLPTLLFHMSPLQFYGQGRLFMMSYASNSEGIKNYYYSLSPILLSLVLISKWFYNNKCAS